MCFDFRTVMDDLGHRQYRLSRILLSLSGLWPYEDTWLAFVKRILFSVAMVSSVVFQVAAFLHAREYTQNNLVNVVTNLTFTTIFSWKYFSVWYNIKSIRKLVDMIRQNWKLLNNEEEKNIILKYAHRGNLLNLAFTFSFYLAVFSILMCQHRTSPNDKSRFSDDLQINMYYFTDNERYFYMKLLHLYAFILMGATTTTGAEVTTLLLAHHSSGLFHVVCYRIKRALNAKSPKASFFEKNKTVSEALIDVAKMHKRTLKYSNFLGITFGSSYFVLLSLGVVSLSLNLVRLSQAKLQGKEFKEMMLEVFVILAHLVYLFLANYMGQLIMDSSSILFTEAYNTEWYAVPVPAQKLFLYIMQHSMKNYTFRLGGCFVPSYEGFSTLSRLSFSYFMVIVSTQS